MIPAAADLDVRPLSQLFKALADETRLRIVALLAHGELCVCHLQDALRVSQPNVSRQLAVLRAAGVVADRRQGSWVHYGLAAQPDPERRRHLAAIIRAYGKHRALAREYARLTATKGPLACL